MGKTSKATRACALYVRISLSTEESVSIERQIEAGQQYAAAHGWTVVDVFRDEGVSATHNKPEDRKGWQALMASDKQFDTVVVWKVDRLARRITDFWSTYESLQAQGRSLASIADNLDMSTAIGRIVAGVLAGFAEMEAETISLRVKAARDYLLRAGRYAGGSLPYGYRAVENPDGPGYIVVQDEEQIEWVRGMVRRTMDGLSIYSTMTWLNESGAPTKNGAEKWSYTTLDRLMRNPMLAGMVPKNPGNRGKLRGDDVLRGDDGLPVVDETLAMMPVSQWRAMQAKLAEPTPHRQPRAMRRQHSGLLSGLVWCGDPRHDEPRRMWRGTVGSGTGPRPAYTCGGNGGCHQTLSNAEDLIVAEFLRERGDVLHLNVVEEVVEGGSLLLQEASIRLGELGREIVNATPERAAEIVAEMGRLKELQEEGKRHPSQVRFVPVGGETRTFREDWESAEDDEQRRTIIGHALERIVVRRGGRGAWTDEAKLGRMTFEWRDAGQVEAPSDRDLAAWAESGLHVGAGR
jgi:DNA invertase Pin-like site-specific DNA recombinase